MRTVALLSAGASVARSGEEEDVDANRVALGVAGSSRVAEDRGPTDKGADVAPAAVGAKVDHPPAVNVVRAAAVLSGV